MEETCARRAEHITNTATIRVLTPGGSKAWNNFIAVYDMMGCSENRSLSEQKQPSCLNHKSVVSKKGIDKDVTT